MALSKENTMAKNAHLVLDERATIEVRLRERASFTEIGRELGKDPSTISKEVRLHSQTVRKDSFNPCSKRSTCDEYGTACSKCKLQYSKSCKRCPRVKCYEHCKQFEVLVCNKLKKPPYVCNGCIQRQSCKLEKHIYSHSYPHTDALSQSTGLPLSLSAPPGSASGTAGCFCT